MTDIFLQLVHLSWPATVLALAVMAVRLLFRRMPKRIACLLWLLVALRLVLPFTVESSVSLQPTADPITPTLSELREAPTAENTITEEEFEAIQAARGGHPLMVGEPMRRAEAFFTSKDFLSLLWLAGMLTMLGYMLGSYVRLRRRVAECVLTQPGVYCGGAVESPFVLGWFRPRIYLPENLSGEDMAAVLAHERCHIRRKDHRIKPAAFVLLAVYWFNPVLWAAYLLLCRDIEGACDEKVLEDMDMAARANYSRALINCAVRRSAVAACPVAFGEVGVKGRVKSILNYKKPAFWVLLLAAATCIVLAVCFLTDPRDPVLETAVHEAVLAENESPYCIGQPVESHKIFQIKRSGEQVTVYAMVLYEELLPDGTVDCGAHNAAKLTFTGNRANGYRLQDYWIPRNGIYYAPSIRENFPIWLWHRAMDTSRYIARQKAECLSRLSEDAYDKEVLDAAKLFSMRTEYVGDNSAVCAILDALGAGEYGPYTVSLTTDTEPYGITLHYRAEVLDRGHIYGWANRMQQVAWQTLALVENAQWVSWDITYPDGDVFPGGWVDVNDTALQPKAVQSIADLVNLQGELEANSLADLPDGRYMAGQPLYLAEGISDPGWENRALLTKMTTVDQKLVSGIQNVDVTLDWEKGQETLHNAVCISTFDTLCAGEAGIIAPHSYQVPCCCALLAGDGVDSGLRIWTIGNNYYMGRVDEQGQTLYVYRCECTA